MMVLRESKRSVKCPIAFRRHVELAVRSADWL